MTLIKDLTLAICVLSLGYALLSVLVPDRYRSELRSIASLAAAVTVIGMISGADFGDVMTGFPEFSAEEGTYERERLICAELEERIGEYLSELLEEEGLGCKKVSVRTTIDGQNRISITEVGLVADGALREREGDIRALVLEKIGSVGIEIRYGES